MMQRPQLASYRDCTGCMLCADTCTKEAIRFHIDENGFWKPQVDATLCVGCKQCERKCAAVRSNELHPASRTPAKGHATADEVRRRSTSGGIFYALAQTAVKRHRAVVFGAVCDGCSVHHKGVETLQDLAHLQGSKYAQSNTSGIYRQVRTHLKAGRFVLFSGTPCQVNALRVYLGKEYENLLTVDLVCHGVPSYTLAERHLAVNKGDAVEHFRTKSYGWGQDSYVTMKRRGESVTVTDRFANVFYHMFSAELAFRPNCYQCRFNGIHRTGDITIGDYWKARNTDEYDPLGISCILPNTERAYRFLAECDNICMQPESWENILSSNPRLVTNRREYLDFALSCRLGWLYRWLPARLADRILEAFRSKRRPFSYCWAVYLDRKRRAYRQRYAREKDVLLNQLKSQAEH